MLRRNFLRNMGLLTAAPIIPVGALMAAENNGFVAVNITGKVTSNGKGIPKVAVSDGYNIVYTDASGAYGFNSHFNADHVFVSLPSGYEIPNDKGIASFYKKINKKDAVLRADFNLDKLSQDDNKHAFIVWGDTQIQSKSDAKQLKTISAPDTKAAVAQLGNQPIHGIGCGDLVFDHFELFDDYKQAVATTGIPFFQLIGNHDMDYTARSDDGSQETFKSHFGPTYYSFNRGKIHYIVLDNVFFIGLAHRYIGYLTETQLAWVEKDLKTVPEGSTVVVSLHIPTFNKLSATKNPKEEELGSMTSNRESLYTLLKNYKVHIMSGHTHFNENWEKDNIYEHNHGTVCGAWWSGPICGDGTPNGYGIYEVDGDEIKWHYRSTGFDKNHQIAVYKKGSIAELPTAIVANVWNWDEKWKVEWLEDGVVKGTMKQYVGLDPLAKELYLGPAIPTVHKWVEPSITDHLFITEPSAGAKQITVRATDRFGNVYNQSITV